MVSKIDNFYRAKLKNGVTILFEKRNLPVLSTAASIKIGGIQENEKNKGISHFLEHMLFKGTKKKSYDVLSREVEKKGGILNGYTSEENTAFWNKLPSKYLTTSLRNPIELVLYPAFKQKEFEKEKGVIIEEIKMYKDNPDYYSRDKLKELLYKKPFGLSTAGSVENILKMKRQNLISLHKNNYCSNNLVLCVVGNAEFEDILKQSNDLLKNLKKLNTNLKIPKIIKTNGEVVESKTGLEQTHFVLGFHTADLGNKQRYAYELLLTHLTGGMSSVLFNEIREKRGLAYSVKGELDVGKNYAYAAISVGTRKEKVKAVREIILKELKNIKNFNLRDLEQTKEQLIGSRKLLEEDSTNVMNYLLLEEGGNKAEEFYDYDNKILNVKLKDIKDLKVNNFSSFTLIPK
jgi:predicted Zn-dependent peptidase